MAKPIESVPVFLDAVAAQSADPIVRCNYLVIESDDPQLGWSITGSSGVPLPFLLLGLEGIVVGGLGGGAFVSPLDVEELFLSVEADGFTLEASDLWLPNFLFTGKRADPALLRLVAVSDIASAGAVLRINRALFTLALQAREGNLGWEDFSRRCAEMEGPEFSVDETRAFAFWNESIIEAAFDQFPKNVELELPRRGNPESR